MKNFETNHHCLNVLDWTCLVPFLFFPEFCAFNCFFFNSGSVRSWHSQPFWIGPIASFLEQPQGEDWTLAFIREAFLNLITTSCIHVSVCCILLWDVVQNVFTTKCFRFHSQYMSQMISLVGIKIRHLNSSHCPLVYTVPYVTWKANF